MCLKVTEISILSPLHSIHHSKKREEETKGFSEKPSPSSGENYKLL